VCTAVGRAHPVDTVHGQQHKLERFHNGQTNFAHWNLSGCIMGEEDPRTPVRRVRRVRPTPVWGDLRYVGDGKTGVVHGAMRRVVIRRWSDSQSAWCDVM